MNRHFLPTVVILAGPNGAGKSTVGPSLLRDTLKVHEFVNADTVAQGLSAFRPEGAAIQAGRVVLERIGELSRARKSFALESTLAGRSLAVRVARLRGGGYTVHLVYLWLASPELAIKRVAERVNKGGHDVPVPIVQRRYAKGLRNFFDLYRPLADRWRLYDNSTVAGPSLVAKGKHASVTHVLDKVTWTKVMGRLTK